MRLSGTLDLRGETVIVLDDIVTTGYSIEACRTLLRKAGAARVAAIALARTVKQSAALAT
jgi:predicted amidophosphoribosyltransferase